MRRFAAAAAASDSATVSAGSAACVDAAIAASVAHRLLVLANYSSCARPIHIIIYLINFFASTNFYKKYIDFCSRIFSIFVITALTHTCTYYFYMNVCVCVCW